MKTFKKYFSLPAPPEEVYFALTNANSIQLWTGEPAVMSTEEGSEFSMWDGSIVGKNISFIPDKQIVQQWYFGEASTDSIVTIKLHPKGEETSMEVEHTNIPDADFKDFAEGWNDSYFASLFAFFQD